MLMDIYQDCNIDHYENNSIYDTTREF